MHHRQWPDAKILEDSQQKPQAEQPGEDEQRAELAYRFPAATVDALLRGYSKIRPPRSNDAAQRTRKNLGRTQFVVRRLSAALLSTAQGGAGKHHQQSRGSP